MPLKIVDLTATTIDDSINLCIGSRPGDELAREEKRRWLEARLPLKAGGKLAYHEKQLAGMIEFTPIEEAPFPVAGSDLLHINCVWVLPRYQGKGIGEGLLKSCIQEAKCRGMKGVSVVANDNPLFMPLSFFYHHGFRSAGHRGNQELLWMSLEASKPPMFLPTAYSPKSNGGMVAVDILYCPQCPLSVKGRKRIEEIAGEFGDAVRIRSVRADSREKIEKLGDSRKILVDGKEVFLGSTCDDLRNVLANRISERRLST